MTETLSIKVPPAEKARLKNLAAQRKTTITRLMREALAGLTEQSNQISPSSCYDLARDLFENPEKLGASTESDRSFNKDRMKSFGKSRK